MSEASIQSTIRTYFESMHESSKEKVAASFHPSAKVVGFRKDGEMMEISADQFGDLVASQQPSPKARGDAERLEILSLDIAGRTAVARVRDDYLGNTYLDTLSFIEHDGRWLIYNKLYHIE